MDEITRSVDTPRTLEARQLFDEIDIDKGGTLDRNEIRQLAKRLGKKMSEKTLNEAMLDMDADGSGEVNFGEFYHWWEGYRAKGGGGIFSGLSLDFLKSTPPPETEEERAARTAAEEAEAARLAERKRWLRGMDDATIAAVSGNLLQKAAVEGKRCPVCTLHGCTRHSQEERDAVAAAQEAAAQPIATDEAPVEEPKKATAKAPTEDSDDPLGFILD